MSSARLRSLTISPLVPLVETIMTDCKRCVKDLIHLQYVEFGVVGTKLTDQSSTISSLNFRRRGQSAQRPHVKLLDEQGHITNDRTNRRHGLSTNLVIIRALCSLQLASNSPSAIRIRSSTLDHLCLYLESRAVMELKIYLLAFPQSQTSMPFVEDGRCPRSRAWFATGRWSPRSYMVER